MARMIDGERKGGRRMKKYIEQEAAIALSKEIVVPQASGVDYKHRCIDPQDIRELPAADVVEVRHGKWIEENTRPRSSQFCCSVCHRTAYDPQPTRVKDWKKRCRYAYCPNCGADMRGGVNDV